jgi:hypothetical protein
VVTAVGSGTQRLAEQAPTARRKTHEVAGSVGV